MTYRKRRPIIKASRPGIYDFPRNTDSYSKQKEAAMQRFTMKTFLFIFLALMTLPAMASKKEAVQVRDKVFILRGADKPAQVVHKDAGNFEQKSYMRMPDILGNQAITAVPVPSENKASHDGHENTPAVAGHVNQVKKSRTGKWAGTKQRHNTDHGADFKEREDISVSGSGSGSKLVFKKEVITGTVRLPRVKFARVGVPMELRDEEPSLDFTHKTLKDSGY